MLRQTKKPCLHWFIYRFVWSCRFRRSCWRTDWSHSCAASNWTPICLLGSNCTTEPAWIANINHSPAPTSSGSNFVAFSLLVTTQGPIIHFFKIKLFLFFGDPIHLLKIIRTSEITYLRTLPILSIRNTYIHWLLKFYPSSQSFCRCYSALFMVLNALVFLYTAYSIRKYHQTFGLMHAFTITSIITGIKPLINAVSSQFTSLFCSSALLYFFTHHTWGPGGQPPPNMQVFEAVPPEIGGRIIFGLQKKPVHWLIEGSDADLLEGCASSFPAAEPSESDRRRFLAQFPLPPRLQYAQLALLFRRLCLWYKSNRLHLCKLRAVQVLVKAKLWKLHSLVVCDVTNTWRLWSHWRYLE